MNDELEDARAKGYVKGTKKTEDTNEKTDKIVQLLSHVQVVTGEVTDDIAKDEEDRWKKAKDHLTEVTRRYTDLIGMPGVNPYFGLAILCSYDQRYFTDERSEELLLCMENCG